MSMKSFKIKAFLLLLLGFTVYGVAAADTELCDHIPEAKEVHVESGMAVLSWNLPKPVLMLRICIKLDETYKNGLCPPGYYPFMTISDQGPRFLGNKSQHYNAYERFHFVGNLSTGDSSFSVNVTGDVFVGNNTFLALVRLDGDPKATCNRNLTIYHLLLKGHDNSSSTTAAPNKPKIGHDNSSSTTSAPNKPKIDTGYRYYGIIAAVVIASLKAMVVIGNLCHAYKHHVYARRGPN